MNKRFMLLTIFLPLVSLALFWHIFMGSVAARPQMVEVGGVLTEDTVWTAVNSPYVLTSTIQIPAGITLTVEPGVTVLGQSFAGIIVEGSIVAIGTPTKPITFTSLTDSAPGEWPGFFFWDGTGHFEQATIRYGGENVTNPSDGMPPSGANVNVANKTDTSTGGDLVFRESTIHGSNGFGISIPSMNLFRFALDNVTFTENITNRVQIVTYSATPMTGVATLSPQPGLDGYEIYDYGLIISLGTLTLDPGTTLFIPYRSGIILQGGDLVANGALDDPVTITSVSDTDADRWGGIFFWDGSAQLEHTRIRFAGEDVGQQAVSALHVYEVPAGRNVVLANSTIYGSGGYAIAVEVDNLHQLHLQNNQFINNVMNRILLLPDFDGGDGTLVGAVSLPGQDGLDSYVLPAPGLIVPDGLTMTVGAGATLMSENGVAVQMAGGYLEVLGTEAAPVQFTSATDSGPGQWAGLHLTDGTAVFNHAELRFAQDNLVVSNTAVSLQNSHLHSASNNGLQIQGGTVSVTHSSFDHNGNIGIYVASSGLPTLAISDSNIFNNGGAGLHNENVAQVDARHNWWGDASGPAGIGAGNGAAITGNVLFDPWLTEEICTTQSYQLYLPGVVKS